MHKNLFFFKILIIFLVLTEISVSAQFISDTLYLGEINIVEKRIKDLTGFKNTVIDSVILSQNRGETLSDIISKYTSVSTSRTSKRHHFRHQGPKQHQFRHLICSGSSRLEKKKKAKKTIKVRRSSKSNLQVL